MPGHVLGWMIPYECDLCFMPRISVCCVDNNIVEILDIVCRKCWMFPCQNHPPDIPWKGKLFGRPILYPIYFICKAFHPITCVPYNYCTDWSSTEGLAAHQRCSDSCQAQTNPNWIMWHTGTRPSFKVPPRHSLQQWLDCWHSTKYTNHLRQLSSDI